jgi:C-terminal peptidase prc
MRLQRPGGARRAWALVWLFLPCLLGCAGVATWARAPELAQRPAGERDPDFAAVLERFADRYAQPEQIDLEAMLASGIAELVGSDEQIRLHRRRSSSDLELHGRRVAVGGQALDLGGLAARLDAIAEWLAQVDGEGGRAERKAALLRGALRGVDRWATVLVGKARQRLLERVHGSVVGVGVKLGRREGAIRILHVYRGSGAARAGVKQGDELLALEGRPVADASVASVVDQLRGDANTVVALELGRGSAADHQRIALDVTRRRFTVRTVESRMLRPRIGQLTVRHIAKNTGISAERAMAGLREVDGLRGVVLDLRGNSGGSVISTGRIADQFVEHGRVIELLGRGGEPVPGLVSRIDASPGPPGATGDPLVILVDGRTASSAEFLAAALMHLDRGILVGVATFGKAVVQKTYHMGRERNLLVKITVARSFVGGRPLPADGLVPDVGVTEEGGIALACEPQREIDSRHGPIRSSGADGDSDPTLAVAVELLERFGVTSRREMRRAIHSHFCVAVGDADGPRELSAPPG